MLLGALALVVLGLPRFASEAFTLVVFSSAVVLFTVPGMVVVHGLFRGVSGVAVVPVSFTISMGIFALLGVPFLLWHGSLGSYLWISGAVVVASLAAAVLGMLGRKPVAEHESSPVKRSFNWLWVPFALLGAVLASMSRLRPRGAMGDTWVYLAWVRQFLDADRLALREPYFGDPIGTSRARINGWLLEQAAFSKASGMDPVQMVLGYLKPVLLVMSLLAFYALARVLLKSETAALLAGSLYALFFLVNLLPLNGGYGAEFIGRMAEDKFVARFLFFPTALIFAYLFLENRRPRYLVVFAFLCWAVVAVHPVGLAIIGLSAAGFGLIHLAIDWRYRAAWIGTLSLGGALLSVLVVPLLYLLATGDSLVALLQSADISSGDPDVLDNIVFILRSNTKIYELSDRYYIMQPALLLSTGISVAFVVGLPFLIWRLKRSLAARLLLGMLLVSAVVCYVPPVATFFGDRIVSPGQLWRLAWPIPVAAFLTLGWMLWELVRLAQIGLQTREGPQRAILPLVLLCALTVAAPAAASGVKQVYGSPEVNADPIYPWLGHHIHEPSVVLAPDFANESIPAYSAEANVVSFRGHILLAALPALERRATGQIDVPQGALDVRDFFRPSSLEEKMRIIRRDEVDYVMLTAGSRLDQRLKDQPGFTALDTPEGRFGVDAVDRSKLPR